MSGANVSPIGRNKEEWFVQLPIIGGLNQPPRLRPLRKASRHFLSGRSHPSLSKEGTSAFPSVVFNTPVSSKRCGTWQACSRRGFAGFSPRSFLQAAVPRIPVPVQA